MSRSRKVDVSHLLGASQLFGRWGIDVDTGVDPRVWQTNSNSVCSMSVMTRIPILARKFKLNWLYVEVVLLFVMKDAIHGGVVADDDVVVVYVRFGSREAEYVVY